MTSPKDSSACRFIRKNGSGFEYGFIQVTNPQLATERRLHIVTGTAATAEDALAANSMALSGTDLGIPTLRPLVRL